MIADFPTRWLRNVCLAVTVASGVLLGGCSVASVFYNQVDWLLTDYVAELAELEVDQRSALAERVRGVHEWHRRDELPRYAALLDDVLAALDSGLDEAATQALYERGRARYWLLMERIATVVAPSFADLNGQQLEALERNLAARNEEFKEDFASSELADRQAHRRERMRERFERVIGVLSAGQLSKLDRMSDQYPDSGQLWLDYRVAQQIRLLGLVKQSADTATVEAHLRGWFAQGGGRGPRLQKLSTEIETHVVQTVVAIVGSLDQDQSQHLREQLNDFRALARELSKDS